MTNKLINFNDVIMQGGSFGSKSNKSQIIPESKLTQIISPEDASDIVNNLNSIKDKTNQTYASFDEYFKVLRIDGKGCVADYVKENQNQVFITDDVIKSSEKARQTQLDYNKSIKEGTLSYKASKVALQALATVGNMFVSWAVSKAFELAVTAISNYINRVEIAKEKTEEAIQSYENITSKVEELSDEIKNLDEQSKNLDPITDKEELANLELKTEELRTQLAILQEQQRIAKDTADTQAKEALGMTTGSKYSTDLTTQTSTVVTDTGTYYTPIVIEIPIADKVTVYEELALATAEIERIEGEIGEKLKEGFMEDSEEVKALNDELKDVKTHASQLASDIMPLLEGLDIENDAESKALYDSIMTIVNAYTALIDKAEEASDAVESVGGSTNELDKWSFSETITQLDTVKESLATLDEAYAKLFDGDKTTNIGFDDFSAINEAFADVTNIDDYIQRLQQAGQNTEQVTLVMEDLIGAYLEQSNVLSNVTDENKDLIISMLEEMGIINAEEIVLAQLSHETEMLAVQKQFATEKGYELANATVAEANEFINEANCSDVTKQALAQLALEKINVNEQQIDTASDIDNVIALANAALASEAALYKLQKAKNILAAVESAGSRQRAGYSEKDYNEALKIVEQIENGTFDYDFQAIDPDKYKATSSAKYTPKYSPQSVTGTETYKALEDTAKSAKSEFSETIDFFEERIENLDDALSLLKSSIENVTGSFAKNELISAQIDLNAQKMTEYASALEMYSQKANEALSSIPENLRDKVINGAVDITTFVGDSNEAVVDAIKEYQEWADKIQECNQQLAELQQTLEDLELQKFTNIMEDFSSQFDIYENSKSLIDKQIDLFKEAGELIGSSFYDVQIDQSQKQLALLQEEKKQLVEQMNSALASGRVKYCPLCRKYTGNYIG